MSILQLSARYLPTALTFVALGGLFWWGHHSGWTLAKPVAEQSQEAGEQWCAEHHVPELGCILCHKPTGKALVANEPAAQVTKGEDIRFAQVASVEALEQSGIQVEPIHFANITPRLRVNGETRYAPDAVSRVASRNSGVLLQMPVHIGTALNKGDLVAVMDVAEVGRAKSALMHAIADISTAKANALRVYNAANAGFGTAGALQESDARQRSAAITLLDAEQALRNLGLNVDSATLLELDAPTLATRLRRLGLPDSIDDGGSANLLPLLAPRAGVVTELHAVAGESVDAQATLLVLADTDVIWLSMPMTSDQMRQIQVDNAILFTAGDLEVSGTLSALTQAADPQTRLFNVWAQLPNLGQHLRVGMFGSASISTGPAISAALVPRTAIQFDGTQAYVFVRRSDTIFRSLAVRILSREGDQVAVDRLRDGDAIAVSGTSVLFSVTFPERMGAGCTDD